MIVVIFLIICGVSLIVISLKSLKKSNKSFKDDLHNSIDNFDDTKKQIGLLRKEFAETILDLQQEIEDLHIQINEIKKKSVKDNQKLYDNNKREDKKTYILENNSIKTKKVKECLDKGFTDDEIAQKLDIGKGEVLLIKELYLR